MQEKKLRLAWQQQEELLAAAARRPLGSRPRLARLEAEQAAEAVVARVLVAVVGAMLETVRHEAVSRTAVLGAKARLRVVR